MNSMDRNDVGREFLLMPAQSLARLPLPVHVVCTHPELREQIEGLLGQTRQMYLVYASVRQCVELANVHTRGCFLVDHADCQSGGVDWLAAVQQKQVVAPTVFLTEANDVTLAVKLLKGGAFDVVERHNLPGRLDAAVQQAIWHDHRNGPQERFRLQMRERLLSLSSDELEVLGHIMNDLSNGEIAVLMARGKRTVEQRSSQILQKLRVRTRGQLTRCVLFAQGSVRLEDVDAESWTLATSRFSQAVENLKDSATDSSER